MNNILEIDSVIHYFGTQRILSDVYLKCSQGETVGLLGRNGTGKTTLLRIIFGELETPNKSIRINKKSIYSSYKNPGLISFLPQFNFILKSISLKKVFKYFELDFDEFVKMFPHFKKYYNMRLSKLSGGERRIVEIFAMLTANSLFCLLDEPFTHIMPVHIETIKHLIEQEKKKKGIIIIDHQYKNVIEICDKVYVIENGKTNLVLTETDYKKFGYLN